MTVIDHLHLRIADLEASRRFHRAGLEALGQGFDPDAPGHFAAAPLYVDSGPVSPVHFASTAPARAAVDHFQAAGGRGKDAPGHRDRHSGHDGAFLLDPDGDTVEVVRHGDRA